MGAKIDKAKDKVVDKVANVGMADTKGNVSPAELPHLAATKEQITANQAGIVPPPKDVGGNAKEGSKRDALGDTSKTGPGIPADAPEAPTTATSAPAGAVKPLGGALAAGAIKKDVEPGLQEMQKTRKDEPGAQTESKVLGTEDPAFAGQEPGKGAGKEGDLNLGAGKQPKDKVEAGKTVVPDTSNLPKKR